MYKLPVFGLLFLLFVGIVFVGFLVHLCFFILSLDSEMFIISFERCDWSSLLSAICRYRINFQSLFLQAVVHLSCCVARSFISRPSPSFYVRV